MNLTSYNGAELSATGTIDANSETVTYDTLTFSEHFDEEIANDLASSCVLTFVYTSEVLFVKNTTISLTDYGFNI